MFPVHNSNQLLKGLLCYSGVIIQFLKYVYIASMEKR